MSIYYSKSRKAFFDDEINPYIPKDAVAISREDHIALLEGQSQGLVICFDGDIPILVPPAGPTDEEIKAIERSWRNNELNRADIELNKVQDGMGVGSVASWREYRCALRRWPEHEKFPDINFRPVAPDNGDLSND